MKLALAIWSVLGLVFYLWGGYAASKYSKDDPMRGIYQMPGGLMLVIALVWAVVLFFNWLLGLGLALSIIYGLYLLIRTDSQAVNDRNVLFGFVSVFVLGVLVFFLG